MPTQAAARQGHRPAAVADIPLSATRNVIPDAEVEMALLGMAFMTAHLDGRHGEVKPLHFRRSHCLEF